MRRKVTSYIISFVTITLLVLLASTTTSPLYDGYHFWYHHDSGVFQEMGLLLLQGGTPFVDLFDNKGTLLLFIQAIGLFLSKKWGLFILQVINLFLTLIIWGNTVSKLDISKKKQWIIFLFTLFFLVCFIDRGNLTEEWSLLFISYSIYLLICDIKENTSLSLWKSVLLGLCIGCISFIRINNNAPIIGFFVIYVVELMRRKEYTPLLRNIIGILIGILLITIPCVLFYYFKDGAEGVQEMIYGTFLYNFEYLEHQSSPTIVSKFLFYLPGLCCPVASIVSINKSNWKIALSVILSIVISILAMGQNLFVHYLIVFVPLIFVSGCLIGSNHQAIRFTTCCVIMLLAMAQSYRIGQSQIDCMAYRVLHNNPPKNQSFDEFHSFVSKLSESEKESIYNQAYIWPSYFVEEGLVQCNRIMLPYHIDTDNPLNLWRKDIEMEKICPQCVLCWNNNVPSYVASNYAIEDSIHMNEGLLLCYKK